MKTLDKREPETKDLAALWGGGMHRAYLTASFRGEHINREDAAEAFFGGGENCEICNNSHRVVTWKNE